MAFSLERSQSLRISKKSLRSMSNMSKGGSLRLSKRDAVVFSEEDEDNAINAESAAAATAAAAAAAPDGGKRGGKSPSKSFERKNSFLGKLFSSRSKAGGGDGGASNSNVGNNCSSSSGNSGNSGNSKKAPLGTFSAQFPPPEMVEHYNAIYTPIVKRAGPPR